VDDSETGELVMTLDIDSLSQAKHWSSTEIATLVRDLAPQYIAASPELRRALDKGGLFRIAVGAAYDHLAVETALVALILANVSVHDPLNRRRQIEAISAACADLGVRYEDALQLTASEESIKGILATH
jgi:hypothetical protein